MPSKKYFLTACAHDTATFRLFVSVSLAAMLIGTVQADDYSVVSDKKDTGYDESEAFMEWHGYLNFEYDDKQNTNSNFDNHEFYLSVSATISERIKVMAEFEYEHTPEKLITPIQAYGDYRVFDDDSMYVRAGLWYIPIGLPPADNLRGNGNKMIRQVAVIHDVEYENWAESGIDIWGAIPIGKNSEFSYDIYMGNGVQGVANGDSWFQSTSDLQSHSEDNNYDKVTGVHLGLNINNASLGNFGFGISYATQAYTEEAGEDLNQTHTGFDFRYENTSGVSVQAEWLQRDGDDLSVLTDPNISVEAGGWYLQVAKKFLQNAGPRMHYLELVLQLDKIDLNKRTDTNKDLTTQSVGLIWSPEEFMQVKLEYDIVSEDSGADIDNNVFWAAVVYQF